MTIRSEKLWAKNLAQVSAVHGQGATPWNALLDRVAAKVKSRRDVARATASEATQTFEHEHKLARARMLGGRLEDSSLSAVEQTLVTKAGWDEPQAATWKPLTPEEELAAKAGWGE